MNFRHHRPSPSSDRFLSVFSRPSDKEDDGDEATTQGTELNEDDVFWTGVDFSEPPVPSRPPARSDAVPSSIKPNPSGILAALPEESLRKSILYRKAATSTTATRNIPLIPRVPSAEVATRVHRHSAPVNVPVLRKAMETRMRRKKEFFEADDDEDGGEEQSGGVEEDSMLPPHEIVARGSALTANTTFSVLEGVGRTLKGRDLRQVRNAVWRQTGFID